VLTAPKKASKIRGTLKVPIEYNRKKNIIKNGTLNKIECFIPYLEANLAAGMEKIISKKLARA
jgi:hypothetical protein